MLAKLPVGTYCVSTILVAAGPCSDPSSPIPEREGGQWVRVRSGTRRAALADG